MVITADPIFTFRSQFRIMAMIGAETLVGRPLRKR
jgi:hypothetical protein